MKEILFHNKLSVVLRLYVCCARVILCFDSRLCAAYCTLRRKTPYKSNYYYYDCRLCVNCMPNNENIETELMV